MGALKQFIQATEIMLLPAVATVIFFAILSFSIAWVFRPKSKGFYEKMSLLPFSKNEEI